MGSKVDLNGEAVLGAGLRRVNHPTTRYFYFAAPGGQVFRIVGRR